MTRSLLHVFLAKICFWKKSDDSVFENHLKVKEKICFFGKFQEESEKLIILVITRTWTERLASDAPPSVQYDLKSSAIKLPIALSQVKDNWRLLQSDLD